MEYVLSKISKLGFDDDYELITYGEKIKFIKVSVKSYNDVIKLAEINGVKSIDFFQEYSLPSADNVNANFQELIDSDNSTSDVTIGIIDGGISFIKISFARNQT